MAMRSVYYQPEYQRTIIHRVKEPFVAAMAVLTDPAASRLDKLRALNRLRELIPVVNGLPEPTIENTRQPLSRILIGIRDRFFRRLVLPTRWDILRTIINFAIIIVDTDFYRPFVLWWLWEIKKSDLPPLGPAQPDPHFFKDE